MLISGAGLGLATCIFAMATPGHTPLHLGCMHHNHGPKWHAGHGQAAAPSVIGEAASEVSEDIVERGAASRRGR